MTKVFLIGGGWNAETFSQTYGRFLESATRDGERRIAVIVAEETGADAHAHFQRFFGALEIAGLNTGEASKIIVSKQNFLTAEKLADIKPSGVFVCGGLTPAYFDALCIEKSWLEYLTENNIPYCGFSAGAAIAAKKAIVGGFQRRTKNKIVQIADENAGEDLDLLDVRDGLDLVDFTVDVHATQWGTLSRLVHAIDAERFPIEGWAIDENTMLETNGSEVKIYGTGNAYRIQKQNDEMKIEVLQSDR